MCGIMGFVGDRQAVPVLLEGLAKLEYRGYDSAGISVLRDDGALETIKKKGPLSALEAALKDHSPSGRSGIGHTRWATHGAPSDQNAHPHTNSAGDIAIIHNGIIENYQRIREWLSMRGYSFRSQTDSEVIAHLINYYYRGDLLEAVREAVPHLVGSYALVAISSRAPGELVAARKDSPLVIGLGHGENYVASDIPALLSHTRDVLFLEDGEFARLTRDSVEISDGYAMPVFRDVYHVEWEAEAAERGGFPHFMLKEINEEPNAIRASMSTRLKADGSLELSECGLTKEFACGIGRIYAVACGTAYHAAVAAKYIFEKLLGVPVEADIASELRYRDPLVGPGDLFIAISQSGETTDTLAAARLAKARGATVLAVANVVGSTLTREADMVLYTLAGPEIAVASTKAYVTQLTCLVMLCLELGRLRGTMDDDLRAGLLAELAKLPEKAAAVIANDLPVKRAAHRFAGSQNVFFLGRNLDYAVSMEGSLKLKEISYIHSEGIAAGELKHGPIALIEEGTLVIFSATQPALYEKTASNIKEVKARGAHVLAICPPDAALVRDIADDIIDIPATEPLLAPVLSVIPAQLFAYYCAVERGYNVDKPRNLAKSVTVE